MRRSIDMCDKIWEYESAPGGHSTGASSPVACLGTPRTGAHRPRMAQERGLPGPQPANAKFLLPGLLLPPTISLAEVITTQQSQVKVRILRLSKILSMAMLLMLHGRERSMDQVLAETGGQSGRYTPSAAVMHQQ